MVRQISPHDLADHIGKGHAVCLIDVRQPWENQLSSLPGSLLIPLNEIAQRSREITVDSGAMIVVYCHHGIRSLSGAVFLERLGFTNVHSLAGGIDAWSCEIDSALARY